MKKYNGVFIWKPFRTKHKELVVKLVCSCLQKIGCVMNFFIYIKNSYLDLSKGKITKKKISNTPIGLFITGRDTYTDKSSCKRKIKFVNVITCNDEVATFSV